MILLLGGTTEGKQTAGFLDELQMNYIYSTRSESDFRGRGGYRFGALDEAGLRELCLKEGISQIIDACHPFAQVLHRTVASLSPEFKIIRVEREQLPHFSHPLVSYVKEYTAALALIAQQGYSSMLALTGLQSIPLLSSFWQQHQCWFRILNKEYSISAAAGYHFPSGNLILGLPQDRDAEIKLFTSLQPAVILTKENGINGKLSAKIDAAIACGIPIIVIEKPALPAAFEVTYTMEELFQQLDHV